MDQLIFFGIMADGDFDANADLYEYDAPSQVVDLKELQDAEGDDQWFGEFASFLHGHCFNGDRVGSGRLRADWVRVGLRPHSELVHAEATGLVNVHTLKRLVNN